MAWIDEREDGRAASDFSMKTHVSCVAVVSLCVCVRACLCVYACVYAYVYAFVCVWVSVRRMITYSVTVCDERNDHYVGCMCSLAVYCCMHLRLTMYIQAKIERGVFIVVFLFFFPSLVSRRRRYVACWRCGDRYTDRRWHYLSLSLSFSTIFLSILSLSLPLSLCLFSFALPFLLFRALLPLLLCLLNSILHAHCFIQFSYDVSRIASFTRTQTHNTFLSTYSFPFDVQAQELFFVLKTQ